MHKLIFMDNTANCGFWTLYYTTKAAQQPISNIVLPEKLQNEYNCFLQAWAFSDG